MLGVRPYRAINESLSGYLLRLAYVNGFISISDLLWHIEMRPVKNRRMGHFSDKELEKLLACLSETLGRDASPALVHHYEQAWFYDAERVFQHALVDFPRVCLCCIATESKPIFDWRWQLAILPLCPRHLTPLHNNCPACCVAFSWSTDLFERCPHCKAKWSEIERKSLIEHADLNEIVSPTEDGHLSLSRLQLHDVMLTLHRVGRPFDVLTHSANTVPHTNDHWQKALLALRLLNDTKVYENWRHQAQANWAGVSALINPVHEFTNSLKSQSWPSLTGPISAGLQARLQDINWDNQEPAYVKPARAKAAKDQQQGSWCYHVNHPLLAQALGVSSKALMVLTSSRALPQLNSTSVIREKLFDLGAVSKALGPYHQKRGFKNSLIVTESSLCFARYLSSYGVLLQSGFSGQVEMRLPNRNSLSAVEVPSRELEAFLIQSLNDACADSILKTRVARALGVASTQVSALVKQGRFQWAGWRNDESVDGPSFRAFYKPPPLSDCI